MFWIVCLLIFEVNRDSLSDVILLISQGVSFIQVQEGFIVAKYTCEQIFLGWMSVSKRLGILDINKT